jgi:PAS domain S-box-containing protein
MRVVPWAALLMSLGLSLATAILVNRESHGHVVVRPWGDDAVVVAPLLVALAVLTMVLLYALTRTQLAARRAVRAGVLAIERGEVLRARLEQQGRTARQQAQERLALIDALFRATPAGLAVFDAELRFVRLNQGLADIHGLAVSAHLGKTLAELLPEHDPGLSTALREALASGEARTVEVTGHTPASVESRTWLCNCAPVRNEAGLVVGVALVVLDISARKEAEREMRRLVEALSQSNRELDQFAYVASHGLKAPLRGIANLASWLEEDLGDTLPKRSREHLHLLRSRASRLESMVGGILQYSRAGRCERSLEDVDVRELVQEIVALLSPPETAQVVPSPELPKLHTERVPLQQTLMNLIANALTYARRPDVLVEVTAVSEDGVWHFCVRDNGPGIPAEDYERIWQLFQAGPGGERRGSGIGLAVVRKTAEARGGRAWVESTPGHGSTFHFTWPKHDAA